MRRETVVLLLLMLLTIIMLAVINVRQQRIIRDAKVYIQAGCHGRYQGEGDLQ
jgi:hypothetical protein